MLAEGLLSGRVELHGYSEHDTAGSDLDASLRVEALHKIGKTARHRNTCADNDTTTQRVLDKPTEGASTQRWSGTMRLVPPVLIPPRRDGSTDEQREEGV